MSTIGYNYRPQPPWVVMDSPELKNCQVYRGCAKGERAALIYVVNQHPVRG